MRKGTTLRVSGTGKGRPAGTHREGPAAYRPAGLEAARRQPSLPALRDPELNPSEQQKLFTQRAVRVVQAHAHADQAHRALAAGEGLTAQGLKTLGGDGRAGLLQRGLGKVMTLEFDERLADQIFTLKPA